MNETPVLIAGGGPVGLSLALGLARHGVRSILFETKSEVDPHSRALAILPRTLEIFRSWGIYERLVAQGQLRTKVDLWVAGHSEPVAGVDLSVFSRLSAVPGVLILPQNRTEALLLNAVKETGLTEVLLGHTVTGFQQDANGVSVDIAASNSRTQVFRGQYLVGCDGAHSAVRRTLGWELQGKTYSARVLLADVQIPNHHEQVSGPLFAPVKRGVLAALRYETGHWRIISTLDHNEEGQGPLEQSAIDRRVRQLFGSCAYEHLWSNVFQIHCRTSRHFRRDRVLLAGDAAHINSPAGGQGMNSGIQDAHNLAWKLARVLAGADAELLLTSYEAERREAVLKNVDRYTDFLTRFGLLAPRLAQNAFRALVFALPRFGLMSHLAPKMGMLDTRYTRSPIVSGRGPWIGHRAPDGDLVAPNGRPVRLLDLAGPAPVLLLFDDGRLPAWDSARIAHKFQNIHDLKVALLSPSGIPKQPDAYVDSSSGSLWRSWGITGGAAALLRPDGHVGWMRRYPLPAELEEGVRKALGS
jgi:2-polyprenyl-6-methoxyphenol hydroxylase-like FAD-dependent oxidoreductase